MRPASYTDRALIERLCAEIEAGVFVTVAFGAEGYSRQSWGDWRAAAEREREQGVEPVEGTAQWASERIACARDRAIAKAQRDMYRAESGNASGRDWRSIHMWAKLAAPDEMGDRQTVTVETKDPGKVAGSLLAELKGGTNG